jgi:integrase
MARGHIRERGGPDKWEIRLAAGRDENGKRKTITKAFRGTEAEAEVEMTAMLRERDTGSRIDPSKTTLGQYLDQWINSIQVTPKTRERYAGLIKHQIKPHLGTAILQELQSPAVKRWHAVLRERGYIKNGKVKPLSDRSVLHAHRCLAVALKHAKQDKLIASNPAADIEQPKVQLKKAIQILKTGEPRKVLESLASHDLYPIAYLALASGMRRGELLGLAWTSVDLDRGTVRVQVSLEQTKAGLRFKEPKSAAGTRTITIPAAAVHVLREHKARQLRLRLQLGLGKLPDDALVFPDVGGEPLDPDKLSKAWKRAVKKLGLPRIDFHGLRHTHASALIAAKEDIVKISRRLGHANPNVTLTVYAHLFDNDDASAAVAIAAVLG